MVHLEIVIGEGKEFRIAVMSICKGNWCRRSLEYRRMKASYVASLVWRAVRKTKEGRQFAKILEFDQVRVRFVSGSCP